MGSVVAQSSRGGEIIFFLIIFFILFLSFPPAAWTTTREFHLRNLDGAYSCPRSTFGHDPAISNKMHNSTDIHNGRRRLRNLAWARLNSPAVRWMYSTVAIVQCSAAKGGSVESLARLSICICHRLEFCLFTVSVCAVLDHVCETPRSAELRFVSSDVI